MGVTTFLEISSNLEAKYMEREQFDMESQLWEMIIEMNPALIPRQDTDIEPNSTLTASKPLVHSPTI